MLSDIDFECAGLDINDVGILGVEVDLPSIEEPSEADKEVMKLNNEIYDNKREMRKAVMNHSQTKNEESVDTFVVLTHLDSLLDFYFHSGSFRVKSVFYFQLKRRTPVF